MSQENWKKFANKMKNKRKGEKPETKGVGSDIVIDGEMIVQRLANIPTGKSMKYERIGAQEFVPYPYEELNMENIKRACYKHFKDKLSDIQMETDILASQNGPSCNKLSHIKNFKLIYVRFVSTNRQPIPPSMSVLQSLKVSSTPTRQNLMTKDSLKKSYPKSISVSSMLKLGSAISLKPTVPDIVDLLDFDIKEMKWSYPQQKKMFIEEEPFSEGGFRTVYKAKAYNGNQEFVIKRFRKETIDQIDRVNTVVLKEESVESLARKAVQMHKLASNLTELFNRHIENIGKKDEFGKSFLYNSIYLGIIKGNEKGKENEVVVVEEFIPGEFTKFINNNGAIVPGTVKDFDRALKAECLCHYTYIRSEKKLILLDIQGAGFTLFDPEIATSENAVTEDGELKFCMGNLSKAAVSMFTSVHTCNLYCEMLGLKSFSGSKSEIIDDCN